MESADGDSGGVVVRRPELETLLLGTRQVCLWDSASSETHWPMEGVAAIEMAFSSDRRLSTRIFSPVIPDRIWSLCLPAIRATLCE